MRQTLASDRAARAPGPSGQFYNWYDPDTGREAARAGPADGNQRPPVPLERRQRLARRRAHDGPARPSRSCASRRARSSREMDWGFYYDPAAGQLRGGAWTEHPAAVQRLRRGRRGVYFTCHRYGALNTEPRIASYLGHRAGLDPARRTTSRCSARFPDTLRLELAGAEAGGRDAHRYLGVDVFEGHYRYRGMNLVPSWGGSMFEALMVPLLVPEEQWGPRSWGVNHPLFVRAQSEHGLQEASYGYWGFSPSNNPDGGYREYGVDAIGHRAQRLQLRPGAHARSTTATRAAAPGQPAPATYGRGVVTPHASFLALDFAPREALDNLAKLKRDFARLRPRRLLRLRRRAHREGLRSSTSRWTRAWSWPRSANALTGDKLQRYLAPQLERRGTAAARRWSGSPREGPVSRRGARRLGGAHRAPPRRAGGGATAASRRRPACAPPRAPGR